jgi:hypothetical protein
LVRRFFRLAYARRAIIAVVGARLDTKLNLHLFSRLLRLLLDYFERHPAGETMYQVAQGLPGPRISDRPIIGDVSRFADPRGIVAVPVLAQCAVGVGRIAVRRAFVLLADRCPIELAGICRKATRVRLLAAGKQLLRAYVGKTR